jgi:hypothetical protein
MNEKNVVLLSIEFVVEVDVEELEGKIAPSGQWDPIL